MARMKREVVEQREAEALEAFKGGASVKEVNEALFAKYQRRMGLKRIYELRAAAKTQVAAGAEATPEVAPESQPTEMPQDLTPATEAGVQ